MWELFIHLSLSDKILWVKILTRLKVPTTTITTVEKNCMLIFLRSSIFSSTGKNVCFADINIIHLLCFLLLKNYVVKKNVNNIDWFVTNSVAKLLFCTWNFFFCLHFRGYMRREQTKRIKQRCSWFFFSSTSKFTLSFGIKSTEVKLKKEKKRNVMVFFLNYQLDILFSFFFLSSLPCLSLCTVFCIINFEIDRTNERALWWNTYS